MKNSRFLQPWLAFLLLLGHFTQISNSIELDPDNEDSIRAAASTIAYGLMKYYHGNETGQIPGRFPQPYYWWLAGAAWGTMIDYWHYTGDATYNKIISEGIQFQVGPNKDFEPANVTRELGNDDQAFWAFTALSAAEFKFPDPPNPGDAQWLALGQAVFNRQIARWETAHCGGGLRWQVHSFNQGWEYKNVISNGGFFQLAARLYRYTGNETYGFWANKMYDWLEESTLMLSPTYNVYDGSDIEKNCTDVNHIQWTYNSGVMMAGAAYMYNATQSDTWRERVSGFVEASKIFWSANNTAYGPVMVEISCEPIDTCNNDQPSFKAYLARWMSITVQLAPFTRDSIVPRLRASAQGAAAQCSGGSDGVTCGRFWNQSVWSGHWGVGEQMSALSAVQALFAISRSAPVTGSTGGTSQGDPTAGTGVTEADIQYRDVTTADKAGAGILTAVLLILTLSTAYFMVMS